MAIKRTKKKSVVPIAKAIVKKRSSVSEGVKTKAGAKIKPKVKPKKVVADTGEDTEAEVAFEVVTKRLVAPRFQGIVKTIQAGVEEKTITTFFSKNPETEVCTVDNSVPEKGIVLTIQPHGWADELAQAIWDEIEVKGLDPFINNDPSTDGWKCVIPADIEEQE